MSGDLVPAPWPLPPGDWQRKVYEVARGWPPVAEGVVICGEEQDGCRCVDEPDHGRAGANRPHLCACGGSWSRTHSTFTVHAIPGAAGDGWRQAPGADEIEVPYTYLDGPLAPKSWVTVPRGGISFLPPPDFSVAAPPIADDLAGLLALGPPPGWVEAKEAQLMEKLRGES